MADFKTLDDIGDIKGKRVLVRVDLNVPVADGKVTDATRIERVAPTILELSDKGAKVILLAHFGRPKDGPEPEFSLEPIAEATADIIGRPVGFAADCIGPLAAEAAGGNRPMRIFAQRAKSSPRPRRRRGRCSRRRRRQACR